MNTIIAPVAEQHGVIGLAVKQSSSHPSQLYKTIAYYTNPHVGLKAELPHVGELTPKAFNPFYLNQTKIHWCDDL